MATGAATFFGPGPSAAPESTFVLRGGSRKSTADRKGNATFVSFRAAGYVAETPKIVPTHQKYRLCGGDAMAQAMACDPPSQGVTFAETRKLPLKVAIDNTGITAWARGDVQPAPVSASWTGTGGSSGAIRESPIPPKAPFRQS